MRQAHTSTGGIQGSQAQAAEEWGTQPLGKIGSCSFKAQCGAYLESSALLPQEVRTAATQTLKHKCPQDH